MASYRPRQELDAANARRTPATTHASQTPVRHRRPRRDHSGRQRDGARAAVRPRPARRSARRSRTPPALRSARRRLPSSSGRASAWRSSFPTSRGRCRATGCCRGCSASCAHVPARPHHDRHRHRIAPRNDAGRAAARWSATSIAAACRVVNHDAHDPATLAPAGTGLDGRQVLMNRDYVDADRRIVLGFVEPHFMAGFSGGYKGVFPGIADIASIMRYHDARMIGHPATTWGRLEGNPTQERIRHDGALLPVDFCVNVTLNRRREITAFFCGERDRGARRRLPLLARDRDGRLRAAVSDRRDHQQRLSARPEPLSGGQGHVGRRAGRRRRRLHRRRRALQRRVPASTATSGSCCSTTTRRRRCSTRSWRRASRCTTSGRRSCSPTSC